ncbi:hypothetical protein [Cerasicoccus arenae]|nr:hypothetical protein [Cerasicoccus arenae]MBK1858729.1 hypothetical protein [Cerasicoccus arenae]
MNHKAFLSTASNLHEIPIRPASTNKKFILPIFFTMNPKKFNCLFDGELS